MGELTLAHPLRRPRWIIGSIIVVVLVVLFVNLGFWQLRRLDERKALNALFRARSLEAIDLPDEAWGSDGLFKSGELEHQRVRITGTYEPHRTVLVRFQTRDGQPGYDVVVPLVTEKGVAFVERGWIPERLGDGWPAEEAAAPDGEVTVVGIIASPDDTDERRQKRDGTIVVSGVRPASLAQELGYGNDALPYYIREVDPDRESYPIADGEPDLSEGPHLIYAIQWFIFATIVGTGWLVLLWRTASPRRRPDDSDAELAARSDASATTPARISREARRR